jgi:hypothetical protein
MEKSNLADPDAMSKVLHMDDPALKSQNGHILHPLCSRCPLWVKKEFQAKGVQLCRKSFPFSGSTARPKKR